MGREAAEARSNARYCTYIIALYRHLGLLQSPPNSAQLQSQECFTRELLWSEVGNTSRALSRSLHGQLFLTFFLNIFGPSGVFEPLIGPSGSEIGNSSNEFYYIVGDMSNFDKGIYQFQTHERPGRYPGLERGLPILTGGRS